MARGGTALLLTLLGVSPAAAQPRTPFVADPHHAFEVSGRVIDGQGRGLAGVEVVRVRSQRGQRDYQRGGFRDTTGAHGRFRFHFSGLGVAGPRTWYLAARRPGCRTVVEAVHLSTGLVDGREGDVAREVEIRMPGCRGAPTGEAEGDDEGLPILTDGPGGRPERRDARAQPSRREVGEAMRAIGPRMIACSGDFTGVRRVRFELRGATGEVTSAEIEGDAPAELRACVRRVARRVHLAPFSRETFELRFPFRFRARARSGGGDAPRE